MQVVAVKTDLDPGASGQRPNFVPGQEVLARQYVATHLDPAPHGLVEPRHDDAQQRWEPIGFEEWMDPVLEAPQTIVEGQQHGSFGEIPLSRGESQRPRQRDRVIVVCQEPVELFDQGTGGDCIFVRVEIPFDIVSDVVIAENRDCQTLRGCRGYHSQGEAERHEKPDTQAWSDAHVLLRPWSGGARHGRCRLSEANGRTRRSRSPS